MVSASWEKEVPCQFVLTGLGLEKADRRSIERSGQPDKVITAL
jgi:hypothetical protein